MKTPAWATRAGPASYPPKGPGTPKSPALGPEPLTFSCSPVEWLGLAVWSSEYRGRFPGALLVPLNNSCCMARGLRELETNQEELTSADSHTRCLTKCQWDQESGASFSPPCSLLILLEERGLFSPTTSIPDDPEHERVGGLSGPC